MIFTLERRKKMKNEKTKNNLKDAIGETLYIPLLMRCLETKRDDAIISDPMACELVEKIEYDFSKFSKAIKSLTGVAIRVRHFDDMVKAYIEKTKNPVVVIIGCGLDTRFHRIGNMDKKAKFYELDIPEVIELREMLIPSSLNDIYIPDSMLETQWMDHLKEKHPDTSFAFIVEGVFMYFDEENIKKVFINLANRFPKSEIHFDVVNKWLSRNSHIHDTVKFTNATFKYGIDNDKEIENWASNLKYESTKLYGDFEEWKRVGIQRWMMKLIPRFKYSGRMLKYQIE
jgi:methyltransferase (TIGR00027 family)